jgi:pimeloyl-ACP methyl ester carboxylesterase
MDVAGDRAAVWPVEPVDVSNFNWIKRRDEYLMMERRYIQLDGLRLSYLERGVAAEGELTLVLLHGLMGCAETFVPFIEELGEGLHVLALDLPGAGQSERREDIDARLLPTAELVAGFLKVVKVKRPVLLGHSHGGAVALSVAARYREMVRSLVLLAPAHPYFEEANPLIRFYLSLPGRLFAYTMPWFPEWLQMVGLRRMAGPKSWDSPERLKPYRENLQVPGTMSHLLRLLKTWHKDMLGLRKALRKHLHTPTMVVWGDSDRAVPVQSEGELRRHLVHSELVVMPGVGHRPAEERPMEVAGFVREWLLRDRVVVESVRYSAKPVESHVRMASLMTASLDAGD